MMKKTILFISPTGTLDNGAEISIFHLMKYLAGQGCRIINAFPDYQVPVQQDYQDQMAEKGIETLGLPAVKWWWEEAPGGLPGSQSERIQSYQANVQALRKAIQDQQADLVITNTANMFQGAVAAAAENVPHFWLIHEFPEGEFGYYKDKLDFIDDYSQEIFAVTGSLQKSLAQLLPHRQIRSFAPFTEIKAEKEQQAASSERRILSVGRLTERKNQLELLKAYAQLPQPRPALVFVGAWDEDYKKACEAFIADQQLDNVQFLGYRDNPWAEARAADLVVFPSAMETFGLVYIESIMNGLPTILSDNPGHLSAYEIFEEGLLYQAGNAEELAAKIQQVLEDFDQVKAQSQASKKAIAERYSLEIVYQQIYEQLEKLQDFKGQSLRHINFLLGTAPAGSHPSSSLLAKIKRKIRAIKP